MLARNWSYQVYPTLVDWLECPAGITTPPPTSKMTFAAWVHIPDDVTQGDYGVFVGPGFWLSAGVNTGGAECNLSLRRGSFGDFQAVSPNYSTLELGYFSCNPVFIAVSSNSTGISFFAGVTPETVTTWGVDLYGPNWQIFGPFPSYIGEAVVGGSVGQFYGTISQAALWWGTQLTLEQLREFAGSCALQTALTDTATFYYPITGDNPEPDYSLGGNNAVVHGTTTVDSICGGNPCSPPSGGEFVWIT